AVFETFALKRMVYSDGALREGALWDLVGRSSHENVRERTIDSLQERFYVDTNQATRVKVMAAALFSQVKADWSLNKEASNSLAWAAELHEVGLSIAHSSFHKHGAYLLQHSDLLGFTRQGQTMLAVLVRNHRRKIQKDEVSVLSKRQQTTALQLIRLLRIAVVLNHSRDAHEVPTPVLTVNGDDLMLAMPEGWLEEHPLTATDLAAEVDYQNAAGMKLSVA
ncbi:MAG: exopolyphosphatase/guanosine-5'-triphosphate,3'-diphosphate pyrophosphatase, partial [Thalassolituus oleivorans]